MLSGGALGLLLWAGWHGAVRDWCPELRKPSHLGLRENPGSRILHFGGRKLRKLRTTIPANLLQVPSDLGDLLEFSSKMALNNIHGDVALI